MGSISTQIYTSELILCFITICVHSATRHNIHIFNLYYFQGFRLNKSLYLSDILSVLLDDPFEQVLAALSLFLVPQRPNCTAPQMIPDRK